MNQTGKREVHFGNDQCIHDLFERQVEKTPDAPALVFRQTTLTYRQLDQKANQLAHFLQKKGVGPETLVAISVERSLEMIIGLLGILKAGAAYLPIDPKSPKDRLQWMLEDAGVSILLSQDHLIAQMPKRTDLEIIAMDKDWPLMEQEANTKAPTSVQAHHLIYTIYTSGSTGRPKGVQIEHRNVRNLIEGQINFVQHPVGQFLYAYSFAFDGAVLLIYWTLLDGGTLVIAEEGLEKDIRQLSQFIAEQKITHLLTFASLYSILLDLGELKDLQTLESVSVAGEACPPMLVKNHYRLLTGVKLLNQYGPTEATVGATIYRTPKDFTGEKVPIGKAIDGVQIYILNENLQQVSVGEIGEIFIGGKGVARAYLNRPELTQQKFLLNPFGNEEHDRLYRTGDLGRWLADGNIDFVGRADHQIKLRGYRIELGEVEAVIGQHPAVRENVVLLKGEAAAQQRLVAYLVLQKNEHLSVNELREFIGYKVQDYMIPAAFVFLKEMPLTTAGKVDRKILPEPPRDRPQLKQTLVKAQRPLEQYLCELWCNCLGLNEVGIHDKFFELGGNSLQAAQFINQLQERLGTTIFTLTIFDHPTIAAYAKMLEKDYAEAIAEQFDSTIIKSKNNRLSDAALTEKDFNQFRHYIPKLALKPNNSKKKNSPAIFILAPPRSGTSLLRIMLAGHPALFAANELQLLGFNSMQERAKSYSGKFALWKEGLVRTLMELAHCTADEAKQKIESAERKGRSTQEYYQALQDKIAPRILVDKSPSYALDPAILEKAEQDFSDAIYIHLLRHPYAMIRSFERMHMDQAMYLHPHSFNARQLGELIWTESHDCIQTFLAKIPAHRKFQLQYEQLVTHPEVVMKDLCATIGLDFHPNLLQPYQDLEQKMVDGIYQDSKPMGDVRLLEHQGINPQLAETWKAVEQDDFLSEKTWSIAQQLTYERPTLSSTKETVSETQQNNDIAIVGMSGRFPGAKNIETFWQNLKTGADVSRTFSAEELRAQGIDPEVLNNPDYVNRGMLLDDADCFDAAFFGYHPKEAMLMDPQHRIFLECAYAALEDAGYDSESYEGTIGVFGGVARNTYLINNVLTHPNFFKSLDDFQQGIALEKDFPATRVAYQLNLKGPAVNVQTACSSSGVAVHLACQSLLAGDSDMLIVGGGRIQPPLETGHLHKEGHALSPDGYCRTFDANAQGMVRGNGMAFIVIKRLKDAINDGDQIHAVIKGTAINNDGANKIGFTAPSIDGQAKAIEKAYRKANVDPSTVTYIECHGTGTALGDPIELAGLTKAFTSFTNKKSFCAVGSVKTNIGHLDAGACVAGIIKTVLALKNECLPASLHYERPNPQINFAESPFFVNDQVREWKRSTVIRRAGVSSFGLGGTNAHIVLEEAPLSKAMNVSEREHQLITLSAKTDEALQRSLDQLDHFLQNNVSIRLCDLAATLQLGRKSFNHRVAFPIKKLEDLKTKLSPDYRNKLRGHQSGQRSKQMVFLFPGGGAQHSNMGLGLYRKEPIFREAVEQCLKILKGQHDLDLHPVLYPDHLRNEPILNPLHAITLLFSIEYATAQLLLSWGIRPSELIGHSLGEYTAACIAGVFSLQDALAIVALRGRLFQQLEEGTMLSIPLAPTEVQRLMDHELSFAAINKPDHCVVSGSVTAIDRIKSKLNAEEIHSTRLHIKVAAHSHMIDPILAEFGRFLEGVQFSKPQIPIVSNLSGTWVEEEEVQRPEYWKNHLRQTVRFADGIETILNLPDRILLEVGPGQTLSTFARQHPAKQNEQLILAALKHPKETIEDAAFLLKTIGKIWCSGVSIDWKAFNAPHAFQRTSLPTYPFEKKSYWLKAQPMPFNDLREAISLNMEHKEVHTKTQNEGLKMERKTLLLEKVKDLFHDMSGIELAELHEEATFLELGFDSLFLTQATAKIKKTFKVKIGFRQLFEEAPNLEALAEYIDQQLPSEAYREELQQLNGSLAQNTPSTAYQSSLSSPSPPIRPRPVNYSPVDPQQMSSIENLFHRQLQIMEQQLALLGGQAVQVPIKETNPPSLTPSPKEKDPPADVPPVPQNHVKPNPKSEKKSLKSGEGMAFGPWKPIDKRSREDLTEKELQHLDDLVNRYTSKTKGSQRLTQSQRKHLSDPRAIVGFNRIWKDMVYQIAIERSKGAQLWDVDGNEYVDYRMAFGISLFGHTPDFIQKAVAEQLEKGTELGILTPLAKKVADLLCELSGMDRATLVNTGSEAISAALRAARTVTGKELIAVFEGDYHGIADEMLVKGIQRRGETIAVPIAPGIPPSAVKNVLVLDYDDPNVLDKIKAVADDLAAVIIEPIQPNNPHRQHKELFHAIRELTLQEDIALVFDEMITGFRVAPRGAQQWFDIEVDIIAYGKIISGGLPMAAVAGKAKFMDAFDGGQWQYGDDSYPEAGVTFFGGTFVKHPLSLAAAYAALSEIQKGGQSMYDALNLKTAKFAERLKELFVETQVPLRVLSTASVIAIKIMDKNPLSRLFFYYLRLKGVHIKEKAALLSTAHTPADLDFTYRAMKESIEEMLEAGFFRPFPQGAIEESIIVYPPNLPQDSAPQENEAPKQEKKNIPLTEGQKEVWVEQRLGDGAAAAYTLSSNIRFEGDLNWPLLQKALQMLVDRHEALRTTFDQEQTTFRVRAEWPMDFPLIDLSNLSETEQGIQFSDLLKAEAEQPMDVFNGPLFRAKLIRLETQVHHLFVSAHHGVADGWSCGVLVNDLSQIYSALLEGRSLNLPIPKQISEYALEQDAQRAGEERQAARDYWVAQFAKDIPILEFPTDRSRPPIKTYDAACEKISIDHQMFEALKGLAAKEGSTLFVLMYAAFQTFIHRLSGQNDFVLGLVAAGQSIAGNENMVTHGVSLLPLRMQVEGETTFASHLKIVRGHILDAFEHQNYTLGSLVKELNLPRDLSRQPIMSILFNMDSAIGDLRFADLKVVQKAIPRNYETFDIFINVKPTAKGIDFEWTYNTDLFKQSTIQRRLTEFKTLLKGILTNAHTSLSRLTILPEPERRMIMEEWTNTQRPYRDDICIHELIAEQVRVQAQAIAVESRGRRLSYAQLEEQSNRLAHLLVRRGVRRGDFVSIFMERSVELLVGLLGILKAGGIYVPLDPSNPADRLRVIIEDAASTVLLTHEEMVNELPTQADTVIVLERVTDDLAQQPNSLPDIGLNSKDAAYVIYTSGSTGKPKGIVIPHHAVIDHHFAMIAATGIDKEDVTLSVASVSFDPSVQDFFLPLLIGGKIVIASSEEKVDGLLLKKRIHQSNVRFLQATPATWRMLIMAGWEGKADMKLMSMGEALTKELSQQLLARGKELWNAYGPSETTIYTTVKKIEVDHSVAQLETGYETLGYPLNNAQLYILDPLQQPVPIGVVGEIYVGGVGLAPEGYLNRPELNQKKFVPDPFHPGQTLYRSGDLGRFLEDGDVEFMGRLDFQVKVRGFRIELGEIESILSQYPGVAENVVVVREDQTDNKRIVAYLIMEAHRNLEVNAIKRYLKAKLPEYMIPSAFVELPQFPLTSSLKVDRKKLPIPDYNRDDLEIGFLAPRTASEKSLAKMWSKLLGIKELGINDNFFELGGHSLIAVNMMAKIEQEFDRKLPLSILLKNATIKGLAYLLDHEEAAFEFNSLVPIKSTGSKVPIYLIHGAGLHVLMFQTLATHMDEEQPIYALQARGLNGEAEPLDRIEAIAAHYIAEVLQQNPEGPYALAGYSFGGLIAFEMAKQLEEMGREVVLLGMFDTVIRPHLSEEKSEQSYYRQLAGLGKKVAWNLSLITKDPIPNLRYKSHVLKRKLKRWTWSFTHNEQEALQDQATDHKALVDRMNQIAFENYKIQPWNREIHLFRAKEQRFFLEDFEFLGWKPFALGGVLVHDVPGDHLTLFDAPHGEHFAKVLQKCLDQTMEQRNNCQSYNNGQPMGKLGQS